MPQEKQNEQGNTPLPKIGSPATSALEVIGVTTLEGVTRYTEAELLKLHGVGPKAIHILSAALAERGLSFAQKA